MAFNGVIQGKLTNLEQVLQQLQSLRPLTSEQLEDWILCSAVERKLQVAVEIVVDVCHRLNSLLGSTPSVTSREAIERCVDHGVLKSADTYGMMVGFRNLVVHRYEFVDHSVLLDIVNNHLSDFETFLKEVLAFVDAGR